jgi:hypothetical protein
MRIWDLEPKVLCRQHLVAEHGELHSFWSILVNKKKGFSKHPETLRWRGKLKAPYLRHEKLVKELEERGYSHRSPLDIKLAKGKARQDEYKDSIEEQKRLLKMKGCQCKMR